MSDKTMLDAANKLAKWRVFFASWQLGSRTDTDGECKAVKHHRETTLLMRGELNALAGLLIAKGVFTQEEWQDALEAEYKQLDADLSVSYPGWQSSDRGMVMEPADVALATMHKLGFRP
jgi:hypothetical protein